MSKEIKFEYGFESVNGIVKKTYYLAEIPNISNKCDVWNVLPIKYVREFTGLKDKNLVEIYEGDIVKQGSNLCIIESCIGGFDCQMLIELKNGGTINGSKYVFSFLNEKYCEVIGNIYEHKDLIK